MVPETLEMHSFMLRAIITCLCSFLFRLGASYQRSFPPRFCELLRCIQCERLLACCLSLEVGGGFGVGVARSEHPVS